jgi:cytoskeletal protein RodZ
MHPGLLLRQARERLGLTYREVDLVPSLHKLR